MYPVGLTKGLCGLEKEGEWMDGLQSYGVRIHPECMVVLGIQFPSVVSTDSVDDDVFMS
jgi:hypothetical protein